MDKYISILNKFTIPFSFKTLKNIFIGAISVIFCFALLESVNSSGISWSNAREEAGELAWILLIFTVFISLISKILPKVALLKQLLPLRKYSGIFVFFITFTHLIFHFLKLGVLGDINGMYFELINKNLAILFGTISFLIMIPLFITSTNFAIRKMSYKYWKLLHKLNHLIFILAGLHIALIEFIKENEIEFDIIFIFVIYAMGYLWLFMQRNKEINLEKHNQEY